METSRWKSINKCVLLSTAELTGLINWKSNVIWRPCNQRKRKRKTFQLNYMYSQTISRLNLLDVSVVRSAHAIRLQIHLPFQYFQNQSNMNFVEIKTRSPSHSFIFDIGVLSKGLSWLNTRVVYLDRTLTLSAVWYFNAGNWYIFEWRTRFRLTKPFWIDYTLMGL